MQQGNALSNDELNSTFKKSPLHSIQPQHPHALSSDNPRRAGSCTSLKSNPELLERHIRERQDSLHSFSRVKLATSDTAKIPATHEPGQSPRQSRSRQASTFEKSLQKLVKNSEEGSMGDHQSMHTSRGPPVSISQHDNLHPQIESSHVQSLYIGKMGGGSQDSTLAVAKASTDASIAPKIEQNTQQMPNESTTSSSGNTEKIGADKLRRYPRTKGLIALSIFSDTEPTKRLQVSRSSTLHEIRIELLKELEHFDSIDSRYNIHLLDSSFDPNTTKPSKHSKKVDLNTPVDFLLAEDSSELWLYLYETPRENWTVSIQLEDKRIRYLLVNSKTTYDDALEHMMTVEGIDEADIENWTLVTENGIRPLDLFTKFDPKKATRTLLKLVNLSKRESESTKKALSVLGIKGPSDKEIAPPKSAPARSGDSFFESHQRIVSKRANSCVEGGIKGPSAGRSSQTNLLDAGKKESNMSFDSDHSKDDNRYDSVTKTASRSGSIGDITDVLSDKGQPKKANIFSRNKKAAAEVKFTGDPNDTGIVDVKKKSKVAGFFGVQESDKAMAEIEGFVKESLKNNAEKPIKNISEKSTFTGRFYFGNMTYTSLTLPVDSTTNTVILSMLKSLSVKDSPEEYGLYEYDKSSTYERELNPEELVYMVMCQWSGSEIFVFKIKSKKKNQLRYESSGPAKRFSIVSMNASDKKPMKHMATANLDEEESNIRRVKKLAGFFGVEGGMDRFNKVGSMKAEKNHNAEMDELKRLLNIANNQSLDSSETFKTKLIEIENVDKEGWLYFQKFNKWSPAWSYVSNGILHVDNEFITSNLEHAVIEESGPIHNFISDTKADSKVNFFFTIEDEFGKKLSFGTATEKDMNDWIKSMRHRENDKRETLTYSIQDLQSVTNDVEETNTLTATHSQGDISDPEINTATKKPLSITDFEVHKVLGRGKFGKVMLCSQKSTKQVYAIKVILKQDSNSDAVKESAVLRSIQHPFIVGLHAAFETPTRLYLVMDYVNAGELYFHVSNFGRFSEERTCFYAAEIQMALQCLHGKGIIYRDLKLENILLNRNGHVQITDFGLARTADEDDSSSQYIVGTLEYIAPEVLKGQGTSVSSDWWSFGIVIYEMLCAFHPFYSDDQQTILRNIMFSKVEFPLHVSPEASSFILSLLDRNPKTRLGSSSGQDIQSHAFFRHLDFSQLFNLQVQPPFKPEIADDMDVRFFDEIFTEEEISPAGSEEELVVPSWER